MNSLIASRLSASKQLYLDGDLLRLRNDDAGRIQSIVLIDAAVETALKTVIAAKALNSPTNSKKAGYFKFPDLLALVGPHAASVLRFEGHHAARNNAQHSGIAPRAEQLDLAAKDARDGLADMFASLGATFETFTMTRFIENLVTHDLLQRCESQANSDPAHAVELALRAMRWIRHMGGVVAANAHGIETWHAYDPQNNVMRIVHTGDAQASMAQGLVEVLASTSLGIEIAEYTRFLDACTGTDETSTTANAWWCADYVARQAYRIERLLPETTTIAIEDVGPTGPGHDILGLSVLKL